MPVLRCSMNFQEIYFMDGLVAELGSWMARCSGQSSAWGVRSSERWPIQPPLRAHQQAQKQFKRPTLYVERISQVPNQSFSTPQGVKWRKWESSWHPEQPGGWTATCWCVHIFTSLHLTPPPQSATLRIIDRIRLWGQLATRNYSTLDVTLKLI